MIDVIAIISKKISYIVDILLLAAVLPLFVSLKTFYHFICTFYIKHLYVTMANMHIDFTLAACFT